MLYPQLPDDALGVMAITAQDLYPSPDWNYVFGQSSLKNRVSVTSMYRFQDQAPSRSLNRLLKVSTHEILHMLSIKHCTHAQCLMNGSNNLAETDRRPNRLCSQCLGKLAWNLQIEPQAKLESIAKFFQDHQLRDESERLMQDLK